MRRGPKGEDAAKPTSARLAVHPLPHHMRVHVEVSIGNTEGLCRAICACYQLLRNWLVSDTSKSADNRHCG